MCWTENEFWKTKNKCWRIKNKRCCFFIGNKTHVVYQKANLLFEIPFLLFAKAISLIENTISLFQFTKISNDQHSFFIGNKTVVLCIFLNDVDCKWILLCQKVFLLSLKAFPLSPKAFSLLEKTHPPLGGASFPKNFSLWATGKGGVLPPERAERRSGPSAGAGAALPVIVAEIWSCQNNSSFLLGGSFQDHNNDSIHYKHFIVSKHSYGVYICQHLTAIAYFMIILLLLKGSKNSFENFIVIFR